MASDARRHLPLALVVAAVASYWWPFLEPGLHGGDFAGHLALREMLAGALADGPRVPLWTADAYLGASLISAYAQAVFSLVVLEPFAQLFGPERGFAVGAVTLISLSSVAMYVWAYEWSGSRWGALLAALLYGVQAPLVAFVAEEGQMHQPVTLATVPFVFLAWHRFAQRHTWRRGVLAAMASALLLYDMQRFWMVFPFAVAGYFGVAIASAAAGQRGGRAARAAAAAGAVGVGLACLVAFPALPMLEERDLLQWHPESAIDAYREKYSLVSALQLVDRAGAWTASMGATAATTGRPGHWYLGLVAIASLGLGALGAARGRLRAAQLARLTGTVACLALAVALAFGPTSIFARSADFARAAGGSATAGGLVALALAALAAIVGLQSGLVAAWPAQRNAIRFATLALAALLIFAAPFDGLRRVFFVYDLVRAPAHFAFPLVPFLAASAASLAVAAWEPRVRRPGIGLGVAAIVLAVHVVDLAAYRDRLRPAWSSDAAALVTDAFARLRDRPDGRILDASGYSPISDWGIARYSDHPAAWGWLSWRSSRHTSELFRAAILPSLRGDTAAIDYAAGLAGLAQIRYVSQLGSARPLRLGGASLQPRIETAQLRIYENLRALPFAQYYSELALLRGGPSRVLPQVARLARRGVASLTLGPGETKPEPLQPTYRGAGRGDTAPGALAAPCRVARPRDEHIALACEFAAPGYLLVAESWSPRWQVRVAGQPRELLRLNHAFQAVEIGGADVGPREVVFEYVASPLVRASLAISLLAWISALAITAGSLVRDANGRGSGA